MNRTNKRFNLYDLVFAALLAVFAALLIRSAFYSVGNADEELLIMNAFRFAKGDRLLVDDWHIEQLCSIFLYIPVKLFLTFRGGTEGIVIYSRLLYAAMQASASVIAYVSLRRYKAGAVVAALLFFVNIPLDVFPIVYYNSVLCVMMLFTGLLLVSHSEKPKDVKLVAAGSCFAFAVLCSPYSSTIYFVYTVVAVICLIIRKKYDRTSLLHIRSWAAVTCGVFISFAVFCVYALRGNTVGDIIRNVPMIFRDSEYTGGLFDGIVNFVPKITDLAGNLTFTFTLPALIIGALLLAAVIADQNRVAHGSVHLGLSALWCAASLIIAFTIRAGNLSISPLISAAAFLHPSAVAYAVTKKKNKELFRNMYLLPLAVIVIRCFESDLDFLAGSSIAPVCFCSGAIMIYRALTGIPAGEKTEAVMVDKKTITSAHKNRISKLRAFTVAAVTLAVCMQFGSDVVKTNVNLFKSEFIFATSKREEAMDTRIGRGPLKGIITTRAVADVYSGILTDLERIAGETNGPVMVPVEMCWIYLYLDDNPVGTYAGYLPANAWDDFCSLKMKDYYEYHPEKYPACIYVPYYSYRYVRDGLNESILNNIINDYNVTEKSGKAGYILKVNGQYEP
ncbi:MAG: hypothetical protein K6G90_01560 [Clostridia bacterium]|nr:hypothetical protein [Clostridia bacterium]